MAEMTFAQYLEKMRDAQNSGIPVNWEAVANNLAASGHQAVQRLEREVSELKMVAEMDTLPSEHYDVKEGFKGVAS
jgi:hypothetical protein